MKPLYYPMLLSPYCKETIWGGKRLGAEYNKTTDIEPLGETWELTVREAEYERNIVVNGEYAGMTLNDLLGDEASEFPLLVKFLDAGDKLSVQVHPIKNEMWYIVECDEGAELVMGLSEPYDRAKLLDAAKSGNIDGLLRRVKVKKGDCFYIPQGLVHAIGAGILIAEIQENSDITYRVYDYDRKQKDGTLRQLHINEAADVIRDYDIGELESVQYEKEAKCAGLLAACKSFTSRLVDVDGECEFSFDGRFAHILCLDGEGSVGDVPISKGGSCVVFDECDVRTLSGKMTVIVSYCLPH